jgi:hypothetical protein
MAARAIVGIALGMLFLPVIVLFLNGDFYTWITSITSNFNGFLNQYITAGIGTPILFPTPSVDGALTVDLIGLFTIPLYTLSVWLPIFAINIIAWVIIGMWAGAVERSAGRGIGVAVGIWLGWIIIEVIMMAMAGLIGIILSLIMVQWFSLVIAIIFAAIFGAITKSELEVNAMRSF